LHVTENEVESPTAAFEMLHHISSISEENSCICIPVRPVGSDDWTKQTKNCQRINVAGGGYEFYKFMEGLFSP